MTPLRRNPRRLAGGVALGCAAVVMGWLALLTGQLGQPVVTDQWVAQSYERKMALAAALQGPRVLVVGGSGALFGLDSATLAQSLGRPVVNLGVNAGVQSQFIRRYAYDAIRPGDWVILPLEYPLYHDRHRINYAFDSYWLSHPGFGRLDLSPLQLVKLLWFTPLSRVADGYLGLPEGFRVEGLYGPQNQNAQGDQVNSEAANQEIWMREAVERSADQTYGADAKAFQANWDRWAQLAKAIEHQGGCAIFVPPPLLDRPTYHRGVEAEYYSGFAARARKHGLDYLGDPFDFMYPLDHFFDTNFHLNAEARRQHTAKVASLLAAAFEGCEVPMLSKTAESR